MKRQLWLLVTTMSLTLAWSGVPALANGASGRFSDDDRSIHESAIEAIADTGITKGCNPPANDRFCPDSPVTRGQMAAFLHRSFAGRAATGTGIAFTDLGDSIFITDIEWLAAAGITKGCNPPTNDRFCPDSPVTRGEMAAFLVRALGLGGVTSTAFVDDDGSVFERDIELLAAAGITRGCNPPANDRFCPDRAIVRAEMATFLTRALDLSPRLPTLDLINGYDCTKDGLVCRATITSPGGRRLRLEEGWDHATPLTSEERTELESAAFRLLVNGSSKTVDLVTATGNDGRRWTTELTVPAAGSITIDGRWLWDGVMERRTVLTIVAN